MRYFLAFVLAFCTAALSADVKPFVFDRVSGDSAAQQDEFDYMLKYKLFGRDYLKMGRRVIIPDKSGWNGTAGNITSAEQISLGGTTLAGGYISVGDACQFTTGPIRATSLTAGNDNGGSMFGGTVCLEDTTVSSSVRAGLARAGGHLTDACPELPGAPANLSIPVTDWPSDGYRDDIILAENNAVAYIDVPDGEGTYDVYFHNIHTGVGGKNGTKVYVRMQDGGRLTRIFVESLEIGNHTTFNVVYRTADGDVVQTQKQYRGNVMFYSNNDITFDNTDNVPIQGSFITTAKIYLKCNLDFAGQLLANQLEIGDDFKGENFKFVPFDPDTLDIDPELNKDGGLRENDSTVVIPIRLSDTATVDVYFNYCFDLKDGVTVDDFNMVTDFPLCGTETRTVMIPTGAKVPTTEIRVNVKKDTITEPSDYLVMKISIESGAVLPNNKTDGELRIRIIDADVSRKVAFDTTAVYSEKENYTGPVDRIKIVNWSDSTRFVLDSAYAGRYSLDSVTGALALLTPVDYEITPVDTIRVKLLDTNNTVVVGYIPISVVDVNEAPEITTASIEVSENLPVPAKVGKIEWADPDTKASFRDNVLEVLVPAEGISVQPDGTVYTTKVFDFEDGPAELEVTVRVYDRNTPSLADTATVKFVITDLDESPSVRDTTFHVKENTTGPVGTLSASDPEGKGLTYTIVERDSGFEIDSAGRITNTKEFDYEKETGKTIHVKVSDGTLTTTATVTIVIDDENEPVHAKDTTITVDEHTTGPIGKVSGEDEDGLPVRFIGTDSVHYNIDSLTGVIRLVTPYDYDTTKEDTLYVLVTDGVYTDTAKVAIRVANLNEPPALQPNDSLKVPENCGNCIVGIITATDPDKDTITYTVREPGFEIDSAGVLKLTDPLDYEKTPEVKVTVIASDPSGAADTMTYTVKVTDVNEPVHTKDTKCTVKENMTGTTDCTIPAWDDDNTVPAYIVTDTTRYDIDSTGNLIVKVPFDYEQIKSDTLTVIVTDGEFSDTAIVIVHVTDIPEPSTARIIEVNDTALVTREIYTNDRTPIITYIGDDTEFDSVFTLVPGKNNVKVCYQGENRDAPGCDSITVWFSDAPPVVKVRRTDSADAGLDGITIVEQSPDGRIYVNNKLNELNIVVQDTVAGTTAEFPIEVKLDTVKVPASAYKDMTYILDTEKATRAVVGNGIFLLTEKVVVNKDTVVLSCKVDDKGNRIGKYQSITYPVIVNGVKVLVSYNVDQDGNRHGDTGISYEYTDKNGNTVSVSYQVNDEGNVTKNTEGNVSYTVSYTYTDVYGNTGSAGIELVLDEVLPKVEILSPAKQEKFSSSAIEVVWSVDGVVQDTLTMQRLEVGPNLVIRKYRDKAGNEAADTVIVFMKGARDIEIALINPVTKIDIDKVDSLYDSGYKYDPKKAYTIKVMNPHSDEKPEAVGIGLVVDIVLPSLTPTGGVATVDDMLQTVNGERGILVDRNGHLMAGTSTGRDGAYVISTDKYLSEHCTDDYRHDVDKYGLNNVPVWSVEYRMHMWIYSTTANYVNDFWVTYSLKKTDEANEAGLAQLVVDLVADRDGFVKAGNGKALGTGSYITKIDATSKAILRCDLPDQEQGSILRKKDDAFKVFGYKRPNY